MSELSPQAQAVLDAFLNGYIAAPKSSVAFCDDRNGLAAALRAAADQASETVFPIEAVRAIATELENHQ